MATIEDVKKLAALARIQVAEVELEKFTKEFDSIISYVGQLEELQLKESDREKPLLRNVMRQDNEPHESGAYNAKMIEQFPERENNSLVVKQIITHE